MKSILNIKTEDSPGNKYPYLAIYTGDPHFTMSKDGFKYIDTKDIVVISLLGKGCSTTEKDCVYVQRLLGGIEGYITLNEEFYYRLPMYTEVTITQQ